MTYQHSPQGHSAPNFNSHAHVERDSKLAKQVADDLNFNSHAHVERDCRMNCGNRKVCYFNSHAHVERDEGYVIAEISLYNFNSHAHVERDRSVCCVVAPVPISTHTLTWSVTVEMLL